MSVGIPLLKFWSEKSMHNHFTHGVFSIIAIVLALNSLPALAQSAIALDEPALTSVGRLDDLQAQIDVANNIRDDLRASLKFTDSSTLADVQAELDSVNAELKKLRSSFEQTAIGSVNVNVLADTQVTFDWQDELSQILQPIVENLKALTEKPRKISRLQAVISQNELKKIAIDTALTAIELKKPTAEHADTLRTLSTVESTWKRRLAENRDEYALATQQLSDLQNSNIPWWKAFSSSLSGFFRGRGLTLLIAVTAGVLVWVLMRSLLRAFQRTSMKIDSHEYRTRRRLVQYGFRLLTFLLLIVVVISVFYIRGDLLLMGLSILAAAGLALGLRQAVPRYFAEARLLLNVGDIRENERVMYNGIPWQVASLNVHSILKNPELNGIIRLPLSDMSSMVSRPAGREPWFPASLGDFIVLDGNKLYELIRLTPEIVELKDRSGTLISIPAAEFYTSTFKNLSRSSAFGVSTTFGIDYQNQAISLTEVPEKLKSSIKAGLHKAGLAEEIVDIIVEFQQAGASSLDFMVHARMRPRAAEFYLKIERLLQQCCVAVCTDEGWNIPFPHLTVHQLSKT